MNEQPEQQPNPQPTPQPNQQPVPTVFQTETAQTAAPAPQSPASQATPLSSSAYESAPVSPSFQQQNNAALATPANTPDNWPGAFGIYKFSRDAVRVVIGTLIIFWLLTIILNVLMGIFLKDELAPVGDILSFLLSGLITAAITIVEISGVRGQKIAVGNAFSKSLSLWLPMLGVTILSGLIVGLSLLLFIIPFFFVFPRVMLATYYLVDQKLGVIGSLKASWAATKGNVGKVYGIVGASLAMALLMITFIGIPFAIYFLIMYSAAFAVLYEYIRKQQADVMLPSGFQQPVSSPSQPLNSPTPLV